MEMMQESVTEAQVNEMLQLADLDKDGKINYEGNWEFEFYTKIHSAKQTFQFFRRVCQIAAVGLHLAGKI